MQTWTQVSPKKTPSFDVTRVPFPRLRVPSRQAVDRRLISASSHTFSRNLSHFFLESAREREEERALIDLPASATPGNRGVFGAAAELGVGIGAGFSAGAGAGASMGMVMGMGIGVGVGRIGMGTGLRARPPLLRLPGGSFFSTAARPNKTETPPPTADGSSGGGDDSEGGNKGDEVQGR